MASFMVASAPIPSSFHRKIPSSQSASSVCGSTIRAVSKVSWTSACSRSRLESLSLPERSGDVEGERASAKFPVGCFTSEEVLSSALLQSPILPEHLVEHVLS